MNALITGVRGFCGRHLAVRLRREGHSVRGVDLDGGRESPDWVDQYDSVDVCDREQVRACVRNFRPDWLFHLAGLARGHERDIVRVNFEGAANVIDAVLAETPDARLLLVGSAAEYGFVRPADLPVDETQVCQPVGPYATSKHDATRYAADTARQTGLKVVVARPFNIVGAGISADLVVGALVARIRHAASDCGDGVVRVGNLDSARDFVDVEDVVDAYVRMVERGSAGDVFNVCSGRARTIREVADKLCGMAPRPVRLQVDPMLVRHSELPVIFGNGTKARERLGFIPRVSLEDSLVAAWRSP